MSALGVPLLFDLLCSLMNGVGWFSPDDAAILFLHVAIDSIIQCSFTSRALDRVHSVSIDQV